MRAYFLFYDVNPTAPCKSLASVLGSSGSAFCAEMILL